MSIRRPSFALQGVLAPELRTQNLSGADDELQRLILRVDYISSPGYPEGSKARERYGFVGGGPSAIVTTLGILQPDLQTQNSCSMAGLRFPVPSRSWSTPDESLGISVHAGPVPQPSAAKLARPTQGG